MAPITCPRCREFRETFTVPLRFPGGMDYQALCGDCFREVTGQEPTPNLGIRDIKHPRRGRR